MRRMLVGLVLSIGISATSWPVRQVWAQQVEDKDRQAADFSDRYKQWQNSQDPEQKIALGEQLLSLEPTLGSWPLTTPREQVKTEISFGLGSAYVIRLRGIRADNLEAGIAHLEAALASTKRDADPQNWAKLHNNLGIAYWGRIRGERADNQEQALAHFAASLEVLTQDTAPLEWAQLQNNIGIVVTDRAHGSRASNIETAISHFQSALTVLTRDDHPREWAQLQNNLGSAYRNRIRGDRSENQENAITYLKAATTVLTRQAFPFEWGAAQTNLATVYLDRVRGVAADNQELAIAHLDAARTVFTRDGSPQQWATAQRSAGNAFADRIGGDRAANRKEAIADYEAALSVFTRDAYPQDHMRASRGLGRVLLADGKLREAGQAYANAREAFLLLFGQGLEEDEASSVIADAGPLFPEAAFAALQRGETEVALELADEGRARLLAVGLKLQTLQLPANERQRLEDLRAAIRAQQQIVDVSQGTDRSAAIEKLVIIRRELLGIVESAKQGAGGSGSALAEARGIVAAGGAVVMPIVTSVGGKIVIITKPAKGTGLSVIDLPDLTTQRLSVLLAGSSGDRKPSGWFNAYFVNYLQGAELDRRWPEWTSAIDDLGPELWRLFGARLDAALKQHGVKPGARLVWFPSGWLGVLPLGLSQNPDNKRRLADDYEIVYAPALNVVRTAELETVKTDRATLAAVINPTGDLPGTETEGAMVASHFATSSRTLLQRDAATPEAVIAALKGKAYWHFATHGSFAWADARQSALLMFGGAKLSVGRLLETGAVLGHPRLVVLSACETGLAEITSNPDEFIGLPGAFTALGARGVIGTLWPVSDEATALLMAKFYDLHLGAGLPPAAALHRAQAWLRAATNDELTIYAKGAMVRRQLENREFSAIEQKLTEDGLARSRNHAIVEYVTRGGNASGVRTQAAAPKRIARPYSHPYFWAGFIYTGL